MVTVPQSSSGNGQDFDHCQAVLPDREAARDRLWALIFSNLPGSTPESAAFALLLDNTPFAPAVRTHLGETEGFPNFDEMLGCVPKDTELYVCAPEPMLQAVIAAGSRQGIAQISIELFNAVTT